MRRAAIDEQNRWMVERQRQFRVAADAVTDAWTAFAEVQAVAVIGSVAQALWKELPRFQEFRRGGVELWHECGDLDLALWLDSQKRLGELRRSAARALLEAQHAETAMGVVAHDLDIFLFDPGSDRYLGRLCYFNRCPKGKPQCRVSGCGAIPFNKQIAEFTPRPDLLAPAAHAMLYKRGVGRLRSALDLPTVPGRRARHALSER